MTTSAEYTARYEHAVMNTFGQPKRVFVRGQGVYVFDADGRRHLDLLGGIAVNALGHGHPRLVEAIARQAGELIHISNFFATPPQVQLAERLDALVRAGADVPAKVFFTNSGAEANEAAFKVTRRTGRTRIIAMEGCFHGRTMGALALTHNPAYREPFEPLPGHVTWVPYGDADALASALDDDVAAVLVEPLQGENGVAVPPAGFLRDVRELTQSHGALMWVDEVQTGIGRCGAWFAHAEEGVTPDLVTVAKGLGGGVPIGACLALGEASALLVPGNHGSTFGGNPLAAAAALAVLDAIEADDLLAHARRTGDWLAEAIEGLDAPQVSHVRGRGLLRGIVLTQPIAARATELALERGFVVNAPRPAVLRLAPPLVITAGELQPFLDALPGLLEDASS